jgi:EmrB/QacA subfamily drug resistance transporter
MVFYNKDAYKWWVLFTASLGAISVSLDSSILIVCLPTLARVFHTDSAVIGWVNIAYLTMSQSLGLTLARIGDAKGRKRVYMAGLAFYTVGIAACALAQGPYQLILARAVQGVGAATGWTLTMAIVVAVFPGSERGKALGILAGAYSFGLVAGPVLGGLLLDLVDWRAVFYLRVPIALLAIVMAAVVFREQRSEDKEFRLDLGGAISLFCSLSGLMLFLNFAGRWGIRNISVLALAGVAMFSFLLFIYIEKRAVQPIMDINLFKKRLFTAAVASGGFQTASGATGIFLTPFYLTGLGYPSAVIGIFVAILAVPVMIFSPISGRLSDKIGSMFLAAFGMAVICGALLLLAGLGPTPSYIAIGTMVVLLGSGMGIFQPPNNSAAMGSVPKEMLATASAVVVTVRNIGSSSAIAMASALFGSYQAYHLSKLSTVVKDLQWAKKLATTASVKDTLLFALALGVVGFLTCLVRGPSKKKDRQVRSPEPPGEPDR